MKKFTLYGGFALLAAVMLSGCNTVGGFGKDVKEAGQTVENAARK